jgi:hypothetical protein
MICKYLKTIHVAKIKGGKKKEKRSNFLLIILTETMSFIVFFV